MIIGARQPIKPGGRHSNPIVTTPMIALDFSGTTHQSSSHNVAPNQVIKSICQRLNMYACMPININAQFIQFTIRKTKCNSIIKHTDSPGGNDMLAAGCPVVGFKCLRLDFPRLALQLLYRSSSNLRLFLASAPAGPFAPADLSSSAEHDVVTNDIIIDGPLRCSSWFSFDVSADPSSSSSACSWFISFQLIHYAPAGSVKTDPSDFSKSFEHQQLRASTPALIQGSKWAAIERAMIGEYNTTKIIKNRGWKRRESAMESYGEQ
ncbi:hypothetical protein F511_04230 [Dorcoceras hygrometricum]|uniref:Uncharacterized protein n=1 Tax=Dorcoceras hygrometricum TaxID=472368 RepID=A0A2Z7BIZ5_9LAMI|nr:hypothetical protein F511_04230 [Dorcoceras hygrometricum]